MNGVDDRPRGAGQGGVSGDGAAPTFEHAVAALVARLFPAGGHVADLTRLSGGASQETWSFDVRDGGDRKTVVLRRAPPGFVAAAGSLSLATEARLMERAGKNGVPSPRVLHVLRPEDRLGDGFLMEFVQGETIPRKILRDALYADLRPKLAAELGRILARVHAVDAEGLGELRQVSAGAAIDELYRLYIADGAPRPVFEFAFRWLRERVPDAPDAATLVHGDFRNGNLIVGSEGVRAVLDWELAHLGDPMEDLGWLCVNSWRFGVIGNPVGGFGPLSELIAGYEGAGGRAVDPARVAFWETLGTLRWGVFCLGMLARFESGQDRSIERAMIGRRASETEIDLLRLIVPRS